MDDIPDIITFSQSCSFKEGDFFVFSGSMPKGLRRRNKIAAINGTSVFIYPLLFWWEKLLLALSVLLIGGLWLF